MIPLIGVTVWYYVSRAKNIAEVESPPATLFCTDSCSESFPWKTPALHIPHILYCCWPCWSSIPCSHCVKHSSTDQNWRLLNLWFRLGQSFTCFPSQQNFCLFSLINLFILVYNPFSVKLNENVTWVYWFFPPF